MQKWKSNFPSPEAISNWKDAWSDALVRNGITIQMAFSGLQKCEMTFTWPPSLPEFLALCKPPLDYAQAWTDALAQMEKRHNGDETEYWPLPALYWAAVDFGQFDMRNTPYADAAPRWKRLLDKRREGECEVVPVFVPQLAAPPMNDKGEFIMLEEARGGARVALLAMTELTRRKPSRALASIAAPSQASRPSPPSSKPSSARASALPRPTCSRITTRPRSS